MLDQTRGQTDESSGAEVFQDSFEMVQVYGLLSKGSSTQRNDYDYGIVAWCMAVVWNHMESLHFVKPWLHSGHGAIEKDYSKTSQELQVHL